MEQQNAYAAMTARRATVPCVPAINGPIKTTAV